MTFMTSFFLMAAMGAELSSRIRDNCVAHEWVVGVMRSCGGRCMPHLEAERRVRDVDSHDLRHLCSCNER